MLTEAADLYEDEVEAPEEGREPVQVADLDQAPGFYPCIAVYRLDDIRGTLEPTWGKTVAVKLSLVYVYPQEIADQEAAR